MKGIGDLMKQAQQMQEGMQENMRKMQEDLARMEIVGESGAGLVKVTMNGKHEARSVAIDNTLLSEDKEILEDLIAAAINDAARKVDALNAEKMAEATSGLNLPPGMKLPF